MDGCSGQCPIEQAQLKDENGFPVVHEICCMAARQCCFYCFEDDCPIKEVYKEIIKKYT